MNAMGGRDRQRSGVDRLWRIPAALVLAALLCLVSAVPAAASSIQIAGSRISYSAGNGEDNALTVTRSGGNYVFTDAAGVTVAPLAPCSAGPSNVGTCPAAGISSFEIFLGNLDDSAALGASVPGDEIEFNRIAGGAGDDALAGRPERPQPARRRRTEPRRGTTPSPAARSTTRSSPAAATT